MLLTLLLACPGTEDDSGTKTTPAADTLSAIQEETFTVSCAFASCHSATNPEEGLDLTEGTSFASLVNVASAQKEGEILVIPGDSANSYLVKKLSAAPDIVEAPMPDGSSTGLDAARLANIVAWIDGGAADD